MTDEWPVMAVKEHFEAILREKDKALELLREEHDKHFATLNNHSERLAKVLGESVSRMTWEDFRETDNSWKAKLEARIALMDGARAGIFSVGNSVYGIAVVIAGVSSLIAIILSLYRFIHP